MAKTKEFTYEDYVESEAVRLARAALNDHLASAPQGYVSQWDSQLKSVLDKVINRKKFTYDLNSDPLYLQHRDRYVNLGRMAMEDTVGQASALTGGYGNSWAVTAGSQAYQGYLAGLNDLIPDFYAMAADRYDREGDELINSYALLSDREASDYGRYRDTVSDYQSQRDYLAGRFDSERSYDYGVYSDGRDFSYGVFDDQRNYDFNLERAAVSDAQWAAQMAFQQAQAEIAAKQWEAEMAYREAQSELAARQWEAEMAYQQARANASDAQWQAEFNASSQASSVGPSTSDDAFFDTDGATGVPLTPEFKHKFDAALSGGDTGLAQDLYDYFVVAGVREEDLAECRKKLSGILSAGSSAPSSGRGSLVGNSFSTYL